MKILSNKIIHPETKDVKLSKVSKQARISGQTLIGCISYSVIRSIRKETGRNPSLQQDIAVPGLGIHGGFAPNIEHRYISLDVRPRPVAREIGRLVRPALDYELFLLIPQGAAAETIRTAFLVDV